MRNQVIGVFDSGFGGLDVLRGIVAALPQYDYLYLGDTARTPYGSRSPEVIYEFAKQAVDFFFSRHNCGLVIFACHTASSEALRRIQQEYLPKRYPSKKVLGVLIPLAEAAAAMSRRGRVGVIATEATVGSKAFVRELTKLDPKIKVFQQACPLLVPIIEAGEERTLPAREILGGYLKPLQSKRIDSLILGCTHYGLLKSQIKRIVGPGVAILSAREVVPAKLKDYLKRHPEVEGGLARHGRRRFFTTDLGDRFARLGSQFFGARIKAEKANLSQLSN